MKAEINLSREELRLLVERSMSHLVPPGHEVTTIEMRSYSSTCLVIIEPITAPSKTDEASKLA